ncbi:hypothetical protein ACFSO9_02355 [Mesonia maritima]|uniref:hypothetical protein n=1 Tax=Mesonia maritima TaxID=1793873 RepID=UPI00362A606A
MIKKLLLSSLAVVALCMNVNGQVFFEDFSTSTLGNFTEDQINGTLHWQNFNFSEAKNGKVVVFGDPKNGNGSETALITPTLDLSQANEYILYFSALMNDNSGNTNELHVEISSDDGSTWNNVQSYTNPITVNGTAELTDIKLSLTQNLSSNAKIRFRGVNKNGYVIVLGEVFLLESINNQALVQTITSKNFAKTNDNIEIKGSIENIGENNISSIELNWQVDNGNTQTTTINSLNMQPRDSYNFLHPDLWTAQIGEHDIKVWVSKVNGVTLNYSKIASQPINVSNTSVQNTPLLERFTSATCGPCASFNNQVFNNFHQQRNGDYVYLAYHMDFPDYSNQGGAAGDPYYTVESGTRFDYYGLGSVPSLVEGGDIVDIYAPNPSATLRNTLDESLNKNAYFEITSANAKIENKEVSLDLDILPYLNGEFTIFAAVKENETTGNVLSPQVGGNGESEFIDVMMKMIPNEKGTTVNFTSGTSYQTTLTADLSDTFIEDYGDLNVVVFIQHLPSKTIMQAANANTTLGTDDFTSNREISIYPNPTNNGFVNIKLNK